MGGNVYRQPATKWVPHIWQLHRQMWASLVVARDHLEHFPSVSVQMHMIASLKKLPPWARWAICINVLGALFLAFGAQTNIALYSVGFVLLLPGSMVATMIPLHAYQSVGSLLQTLHCNADPLAFGDILFLPATLVFNSFCLWIAMRSTSRPSNTGQPSISTLSKDGQ